MKFVTTYRPFIIRKISFAAMLLCFLITSNYVSAQNVGIGNNSPTEKLDVTGNVKFSAALMPAGLSGTSYTCLTSSGAGIAPVWLSATQGQAYYFATSTNSITRNKTQPFATISGMTKTITVPSTGTYDVWIYSDGSVDWSGTAGFTDLDRCIYPEVAIFIDGVEVKNMVMQLANPDNMSDVYTGWNITYKTTLTSGSHTIDLRGHIYKASSWMSAAKTAVVFGASGNTAYQYGYLVIGLLKK